MAKKHAAVPVDVVSEAVKIRLKCVYAGFPGNPGPGDVIELDADEAKRLVQLGAAERA